MWGVTPLDVTEVMNFENVCPPFKVRAVVGAGLILYKQKQVDKSG